MNNEDEYKRSFGLDVPGDKKKTAQALEHALDIRKFEIGLYWQRAAYFWALIAVAFAGYFAILGSDNLTDKEYLAFIVGCVGATFTWAWFLVNRGSKFWQENWENHVDMLEDEIAGPLYKTILHRPQAKRPIEKYILGPAPISVSKINQWVSFFTLCIWGALIKHALPEVRFSEPISTRHVIVGAITLVFAYLMSRHSRTHLGPHKHVMARRQTHIE